MVPLHVHDPPASSPRHCGALPCGHPPRPALPPPPPHTQLLATREDGAQAPACSFLRPLQLGRCLASAREAARFVSLLRPREDLMLLPQGGGGGGGGGGDGADVWGSLHTLLATGSATKVGRAHPGVFMGGCVGGCSGRGEWDAGERCGRVGVHCLLEMDGVLWCCAV